MHDVVKLSGKLLRILRAEGLDYPPLVEAIERARPRIATIAWDNSNKPSRSTSDAVADEIEDYLVFSGVHLRNDERSSLRDVVARALQKAVAEASGQP